MTEQNEVVEQEPKVVVESIPLWFCGAVLAIGVAVGAAIVLVAKES